MLENYLQLLRHFAERVGLTPVELFLERQEIIIDGLAISLSYEELEDSRNILCFSLLGQPHESAVKATYIELLEANSFWMETGGATIGMQRNSGEIIMCSKISLDNLNATSFSKFVDNFSDIAHYWKKMISRKRISMPEEHNISSLV